MRGRPARCPACGVRLPPDAGRCPTCGHDAGDPLVVVVAGRRRRPRLASLAGATLIGLAAASIVVASRQPSADNRAEPVAPTPHRPAPSSEGTPGDESSSAGPAGPLLDAPTGLHLLVDTNAGFRAVDLDTGIWSGLQHFDYAFTGRGIESGAISVVQRASGVVIAADGAVTFHPAPFDGDPLPLFEPGSDAIRALASDLPDRIWLVRGRGHERVAQEVDLAGQPTTTAAPLPDDAEAVAGVRGGLALRGLDGRGYLFDRDGQIARITDGQLVGGGGDLVIDRICDPDLQCGWAIRNLATGDQAALPAFAGAARLMVPANALSPDGSQLAVIVFDGAARWELAILSTTAPMGEPGRARVPPASFLPSAFWSPAGDRLFCVEAHQLYAYRLGDAEPRFISTDIPLPSFSVAVPFTT